MFNCKKCINRSFDGRCSEWNDDKGNFGNCNDFDNKIKDCGGYEEDKKCNHIYGKRLFMFDGMNPIFNPEKCILCGITKEEI